MDKKISLTTLASPTPAKTCRHRQRSSSGRCLDCGFHREPASVQGEMLSPATMLSIRL